MVVTLNNEARAAEEGYNREIARKALSLYAKPELNIDLTPLQEKFLDSQAFITLFGGAAGGGKSYGLFRKYYSRCQAFPKYRALILRRTFPELKRSLIRLSLELTPKEEGKYHETDHIWKYSNGSTLEFGYCESENDVYKYQSAEYDAIGFDESTHFAEAQIVYMISRIRGINNYPKGIDLATNPGNVGHAFHKGIIDSCKPFKVNQIKIGERLYSCVFIPAKVTDNSFLMEADPGYKDRLDALPENQRKMLRDGDWDVFEGQYFTAWKKYIHVVKPFVIPKEWARFMSLDYGLDCMALYDWAADSMGRVYAVNEIYKPDLILSKAAAEIVKWQDTGIFYQYIVASPDLWNRRQDTGKSGIEILTENGVVGLRKADDRRIPGWQAMAEYIEPRPDEQGQTTPLFFVFENCIDLIRTLPALIRSETDPNDVSDKCEDHGPESARYFIMSRPQPNRIVRTVLDEVAEKFGKGSPEYRLAEADYHDDNTEEKDFYDL